MAVRLSISISQNSQSIVNNTSNVSVSVTASWDSGSWNKEYPPPSGTLTIDGQAYSFANTFNDDRTSTGSKVLVTKTVDVAHNDDGSKTLACYASFATGTGSGTVSASASTPLTTIPRKSSLSAGDGTLGVPQTLTVEQQASGFTHSIKYTCGSESGYIKADGGISSSEVRHNDTSIPWTPPLSLAQQNTTGASVPVTLTITTYNGSTSVGSESKPITCSIPDSVKPSVSLSVNDQSGCYAKYGAYVQGKSVLDVSVSASGNQGSSIIGYAVSFDGSGYTDPYFTTPAIRGSGNLNISATVRDSRQRPASTTVPLSVLSYSAPKISDFSVYRSNASGVADKSGEYLAVKFSATATPLNNRNSFSRTVKYKKITESAYAEDTATLPSYSASNQLFVFEADTSSTYDVALIVTDDFGSQPPRTAVGSSTAKTWSSYAGGKGFAFGKVAGRENALDMGWPIYMNGNRVTGLPDPAGDSDAVPWSCVGGYGLGVSVGRYCADCHAVTEGGLYSLDYSTANKPNGVGLGSLLVQPVVGTYGTDIYLTLKSGEIIWHCYYSSYWGAWQPWECENPPMELGVEYRTTERFNGAVVYTKAINCGRLPNSTNVNYGGWIENGAAKPIRWSGGAEASSTQDAKAIPYKYGNSEITVGVTPWAIFANTTADYSSQNLVVQIWYTKY